MIPRTVELEHPYSLTIEPKWVHLIVRYVPDARGYAVNSWYRWPWRTINDCVRSAMKDYQRRLWQDVRDTAEIRRAVAWVEFVFQPHGLHIVR